MALILGFPTLPLPAPSAKSILQSMLQSNSASHLPAVPTKQISHCSLFAVTPGLVVRSYSFSPAYPPQPHAPIHFARYTWLRFHHNGPITVTDQYVQYWSVDSVLISRFSTCPVCRESLFPGAPGLVDAARIRFNPWSSVASRSTETARNRPGAHGVNLLRG